MPKFVCRVGTTEQPRRLLGQILIEMGLISEEQLERGLEAQRGTGQYLGEILIAHGWITRRAIGDALRVQSSLLSEPEFGVGGRIEAREARESAPKVDGLPSAWLGQRRVR
jgi:hypothetical protein